MFLRGLIGAVAALALAGCGGGSTYRAARPPVAATGASVAVRSAPGYGRLLVDGQRRTLYLFTRDAAGTSRCDGACAKAWPPLVLTATPRAAAGVDGSALALTRRADGTQQATYHGHPLYYFLGDSKPGEINCQDAEEYGGHWWLLAPNGAENRSSP